MVGCLAGWMVGWLNGWMVWEKGVKFNLQERPDDGWNDLVNLVLYTIKYFRRFIANSVLLEVK